MVLDGALYSTELRSRLTLRTRIESATGRSTSAIDTDVEDDTALSCVAVPMKSASDLSGFSAWSPFYMYHCLTSVVQAARMDRPATVLSTRVARWS